MKTRSTSKPKRKKRKQDSAPTPAAAKPLPTQLHIVPVDPQRVFAHWYLGPDILPGPARKDAKLVFRLQHADNGTTGEVIADYPVSSTWHEGFFTFSQTAGPVVAAIGVQTPGEDFATLVMSLPVVLPEAPEPVSAPPPPSVNETPAPAPAEPAAESKAESPTPQPAARKAPVRAHGPTLDEAAILRAVEHMEGLPEELKRLPARQPRTGEQPPAPRGTIAPPPATPRLNERRVVKAALRAIIKESGLPVGGGEEEVALEPAPGQAAEPKPARSTSSRLASQVNGNGRGQPIHLEATLVVTGLLPEGYRLRIGGQEVPVLPGGRFYRQHHVRSFPAAWSLLLHAVSEAGPDETASFELISEMPDNGAALSMNSYVEIEGEVHDPAYRKLLPGGVTVDAAGRFRVVRPVPAGALFLPHLVLVSE